MKTLLIAASLFTLTGASVALYPPMQVAGTANNTVIGPATPAVPAATRPKVEVVFVLDTTGSMSGLIEAAKEKIWSIASTMAAAQPAPEIRMGLVAYRDRGDAYVTRVLELSGDLDTMYASLMDLQAAGGGDGPESVNQGLYEAVHSMRWSQDPQAYKAVFLVGDAEPHMDYPNDTPYQKTLADARSMGIVVNTVQCGSNPGTTQAWQRMASLGEGAYFQVGQSGSAVAIRTPFDEKLAELSAKLDGTRLYYGDKEAKIKQQRKLAATDKLNAKASVESRARRAAFNASESGEANLTGEGELVDEVTSGRVDLSAIALEELPAPMRSMAPEEQKSLVAEAAKRREALKSEIRDLAQERAAYLEEKVEAMGGAKDSLDAKLYGAVRAQAASKGLRYEAAAPAY